MNVSEACKQRTILNEMHLRDCENIKIGDAVFTFHPIFFTRSSPSWLRKILGAIKRMMLCSVFDNLSYHVDGNPDMIMLHSNSYKDRIDFFRALKKVSGTNNNYLFVSATNEYKFSLNFNLGLLFSWIMELHRNGISYIDSLYLTSFVYWDYSDYNKIMSFVQKQNYNIRYALTICDFMALDSFAIQKWNQLNIGTITLQHGTFDLNSFAYKLSHSKYFLVHSEFARNRAIESGISPEKIYITGVPQSLLVEDNLVSETSDMEENSVIGLFMTGLEEAKVYNQDLIKFACKYARGKGLKVYVKMHPGIGPEFYDSDVIGLVDKVYCSEINPREFAAMCFCVMDAGSTTFVEFIQQKKYSLTYINPENCYRGDDNIKLAFKTYEEMQELIDMILDENPKIDEMMECNIRYMTDMGRAYDLYREFFASLPGRSENS